MLERSNTTTDITYHSTRHHSKMMRDNVLLQIGSGRSLVSPTAIIPAKMTPLANSRLGFFSSNLRTIDCPVHGVQPSLAFAQLTCLMILSFRGKQGKNRDDIFYKMLASFTFMHLGPLFTSGLLTQKYKRIKRQHRAYDSSSSPRATPLNSITSFKTASEGRFCSEDRPGSMGML